MRTFSSWIAGLRFQGRRATSRSTAESGVLGIDFYNPLLDDTSGIPLSCPRLPGERDDAYRHRLLLCIATARNTLDLLHERALHSKTHEGA